MRNLSIFAIVLLVVVSMSGCDRTIESQDPVRSVPTPAPTPTNLEVLINLESVSLDWTVTDSSNVAKYRIYVADTLPVDFRVHDSTTTSSAIISNLLINRLYFIQVVAVDRAGLEGIPSGLVSATIGYTSIDINGGAIHTITRNVTVLVNTSALASQVILSEDSTFANDAFIPWGPTRPFTLSFGDGEKIIYGRLVFADGSVSGELLADAIILDTQAEIDSVFILPQTTTFATGDIITFGLDAGDIMGMASVSFGGISGLQLFDDGINGGDVVADDGVYFGQYEVPVNTNLFQETVTGFFTDAAGNRALPTPGIEVLNINTPPDPVDLALTINTLGEFQFSWTLSLEPDFQSYRIYSGATSAVDTTSTEVTIIADPLISTYITTQVPSTFYRIFVFDQHGAAAGSNVVP